MPAPPAARPATSLHTALNHSEALTGLLQRVQASRARLAAIAALLPAGLRDGVRAGPLDDATWVLLVANAAAAAKVRQLMPAFEQVLAAQGWPALPIRIKVLPRA